MTEGRSPDDPLDRVRRFGKRFLVGLVVVLALLGLAFVGAAFLPRWWAHRIGAQAGGSFAAGIALGLFYGFVFTALPLLVLRWSFRKRRSLNMWFWTVVGAALLAAPNLLTLGVVLGSSKAAHAGERTFDVDAPGFRASTLAGAIAAAVALLALEYLLLSRKQSRKNVRRLRDELRRRDARPPEPDT